MESKNGAPGNRRYPPAAESTEEMLARLVGEQTKVIAALRAEIDALKARLKDKGAA